MAPFYGWGSTTSRLQPLRGGSLLFTTQFPEIPGSHKQKSLHYKNPFEGNVIERNLTFSPIWHLTI